MTKQNFQHPYTCHMILHDTFFQKFNFFFNRSVFFLDVSDTYAYLRTISQDHQPSDDEDHHALQKNKANFEFYNTSKRQSELFMVLCTIVYKSVSPFEESLQL